MNHAGVKALRALRGVLAEIRILPGLREKRPGIFYRNSAAFLHFHQDEAGLFADLKIAGDWKRLPLNSARERRSLVAAAKRLVRTAAI